jgi:hypothetical protein
MAEGKKGKLPKSARSGEIVKRAELKTNSKETYDQTIKPPAKKPKKKGS